MLGQRVRDLLSLLSPSPSGDWLWQSTFVPTFMARTEVTEGWEEAVNYIDFSHSSRMAWSTINKLLAGPDTPLVCALSQQTPSLHKSWRTGHTRRGTVSPQGSSTRRPTYERSQPLHARGACYHPQPPRARKIREIGCYSIFSEFILQAMSALKSCLSVFFTSCMRQPIIDPLLPQEQAGFRYRRSTVDHVTLLT